MNVRTLPYLSRGDWHYSSLLYGGKRVKGMHARGSMWDAASDGLCFVCWLL